MYLQCYLTAARPQHANAFSIKPFILSKVLVIFQIYMLNLEAQNVEHDKPVAACAQSSPTTQS